MKKTLQLLIILFSGYSYGQNTTPSVINFWKENGTIKNDYNGNELTIPVHLVFKQSDFTDDKIELIDSAGNPASSGKFNTKPLLQDIGFDKNYGIKIENDKKNKITLFPFSDNGPLNKGITKISIKINGTLINTIKYSYKPDSNPKGDGKEIPYQAGRVYYDAIILASDHDSIEPNTKLEILRAYNYHGDTTNPYLSTVYKNIKKLAQQESLIPTSLMTAASGIDVTNFAAGLSRFLAERAKDELNEAFFNKMKDQLNAYPELTTVFPQTASILKTIETYSYSSVLQVLKEAFETDIRNLPENIYQIKELDPSKCSSLDACSCDDNQNCKKNNKCKRNCEKCKCEIRLGNIHDFFQTINGQWIGVGMFTVKEAIQSTNPADLIKTIAESDDLSKVKKTSKDPSKPNFNSYNVVSSIELGNFISQSLLSKDEKQVWVNASEFNALFKTKDAFQIYLGLLLAKQDQLKKENKQQIVFYKADTDTITFGEILVQAYKTQEKLKDFIKGAYTGFNSANSAVRKMIDASSKSIETDPQALYDYYKTFTTSLKQIITNPLIKKYTDLDIAAEYAKIEQYLNPAVDMAYHISTKKYSSALYDATLLLNNMDLPVFEKPVAQSFIKYGTLISTVASAQSSDEVKKAIEASVLPAGSSAVKRKSAWSISVNAYVGLYYGWAYSKSIDTSFNSATNTLDTTTRSTVNGTYGLYAPIGLSFNRGFRCGHKKYWGITLSTQLLDVGALVNFYATKGDGAALPTDFKVRLSDILSPGLQLGVNIPGPITIMGGFQYVPALNKVSQVASSSTLSPIAWRVQVGIVVDIPLYHLKVWDFRK